LGLTRSPNNLQGRQQDPLVTIACPDCGALEDLPKLPPRSTAVCIRCRIDLEKTTGRSVSAALACSLATFILLFPANLMPLIRVDLFGMHSENVIGVGVLQLLEHEWLLLAATSGVFVIVLPFLRFGLLSAVLGALRLGLTPRWLAWAFRWAVWLDLWAMIDVFLLAGFVGFYRLSHVNQATLTIEIGGGCFLAAAILTMLSRATLDPRTVWRAIGGESSLDPGQPVIACTTCDLVQPLSRAGKPCPRCGAKLSIRKRDAMRRTTALLIAAFVLLFPANLYPMNISDQLGTRTGYTIFSGIRDLFDSGQWPLGALVFCTSILIPVLKILAISWCVLSVKRRSTRHLIAKTRILRMVAEWGRWSKTDPFTIVFFVPLMNFGPLGSATAGWGATAFVVMTFLTMAASTTFDPRLMWDV
jgi:paraquat-inducible protein A